MDNNAGEDTTGKSDKLRMDILMERLEMYIIMSEVFYRRINTEEKVDALLEVAERLKNEIIDVKDK